MDPVKEQEEGIPSAWHRAKLSRRLRELCWRAGDDGREGWRLDGWEQKREEGKGTPWLDG